MTEPGADPQPMPAPGSDPRSQALAEAGTHLAAATDARHRVGASGARGAVAAAIRPGQSPQTEQGEHLTLAVAALIRAIDHGGAETRDQGARFDRLEDTVGALRSDGVDLAARTVAAEAARADSLLRLAEVQGELRARHAELAALRDEVATLRAEVDARRDEVTAERGEIDGLRTATDAARGLAAEVRAQQSLVLRTAREALADQGISVAQLTELSRELGTDHESLYQDLEDEFRGTRDAIRDKLRPYLDDLAELPGGGPVVDVGCGRGEWLELLAAEDVSAYGVDINQVVVDRCTDRGLDVRHGDALVHLREIEPGSVRAVTSFHVVEHLGLDILIGLIDAALVALEPGGLLVFETPNPTNVIVGAASFYLDPTHLKPLHPQFLEFLVRQRGFAQVEGRYLNPADVPSLTPDDLDPSADPIRNEQLVGLVNWALTGPLDFAIVARKATSVDPVETLTRPTTPSLDPGGSPVRQ